MTRLTSPWSGVITRRNERAPAVSWLAKLAAWTFSATYLPEPVVANEPLKTSSPGRLRTTSDSPVSWDSSSPTAPVASRPSSTTWSPATSATRSPRTRSSGATWTTAPPRTTAAVGRVSRAIRSSVRLARISWTIPTMTLVMITPSETSASTGRPTITSAMPRANRMLLTKVKTFSRTMSQYVRVVGGSAVFPRPAPRRRATSASSSPSAGVGASSGCAGMSSASATR